MRRVGECESRKRPRPHPISLGSIDPPHKGARRSCCEIRSVRPCDGRDPDSFSAVARIVPRTRCGAWCRSADQGPFHIRNLERSRFCEAALHAASRPGHSIELGLRLRETTGGEITLAFFACAGIVRRGSARQIAFLPLPASGERVGVRGERFRRISSLRLPLTRRDAPTSPRKNGERCPHHLTLCISTFGGLASPNRRRTWKSSA